ncbi:MAG: hypothetical protein AAF658_06330 [Myxococcota bacterium]
MRLGLFVFLGLAGCGAEISIPQTSVIACESDSQCPLSFRCNPSTNVCQAAITNSPPLVTLPVLPASPRWVRGVTLRATIADVDSDLVDLNVEFSLGNEICPANIDTSRGAISGLESSPTGIAHDFVWTAAEDAQQDGAAANCGLQALNVLSALTAQEQGGTARARAPCAGTGSVPTVDPQDTDVSVDCIVALENLSLMATPTDRGPSPQTGATAMTTDVIGELPPIVVPFFEPDAGAPPGSPFEFEEIVPIEFFVLDEVTSGGLGADFVDVEVEFSTDAGTTWGAADIDGPTRRLLATPRNPADDETTFTPDPSFDVEPYILVWEADSERPALNLGGVGGIGSGQEQVFVRMRGRTTFGNDVIVGEWREAGPINVDTL